MSVACCRHQDTHVSPVDCQASVVVSQIVASTTQRLGFEATPHVVIAWRVGVEFAHLVVSYLLLAVCFFISLRYMLSLLQLRIFMQGMSLLQGMVLLLILS